MEKSSVEVISNWLDIGKSFTVKIKEANRYLKKLVTFVNPFSEISCKIKKDKIRRKKVFFFQRDFEKIFCNF